MPFPPKVWPFHGFNGNPDVLSSPLRLNWILISVCTVMGTVEILAQIFQPSSCCFASVPLRFQHHIWTINSGVCQEFEESLYAVLRTSLLPLLVETSFPSLFPTFTANPATLYAVLWLQRTLRLQLSTGSCHADWGLFQQNKPSRCCCNLCCSSSSGMMHALHFLPPWDYSLMSANSFLYFFQNLSLLLAKGLVWHKEVLCSFLLIVNFKASVF